MNITLSGLIPEKEKKTLLIAAKWAAKELGISRKRASVSISVNLFGLDDGTCAQISPNKYEIRINKLLSQNKRILFLFHEFQHVFQFIKGDLVIAGGRGWYKGVEYTSVPYPLREFEREAYKMQEVLYSKFVKFRLNRSK